MEVGPYTAIAFRQNQDWCREAGIHIVDEDRTRGDVWLTQLLPLSGPPLAITVVLTLTRPCGMKEQMRRVLIAVGDEDGADS